MSHMNWLSLSLTNRTYQATAQTDKSR